MLGVALLSRWHVHADEYAEEVKNNPYFEIKCVWDEENERGVRWGEELGVPFVDDLTSIFNDSTIQAVVVSTPTNLHTDIIVQAAKNKKHIFTEKILAFTGDECTNIYEEVEKNGVSLMVSLPRLSSPYYLYAQKAVDEGLLGELTMARCRVAHNGAVPSEAFPEGWLPAHFYNKEACGGGALIDLGAHPIYLCNRLLGKPITVQAHFHYTYQKEVEDSATIIVEYENGVLANLETSFTSEDSPFLLELYGTKGCLYIKDEAIELRKNQTKKMISSLPAPLLTPMNQWAEEIVSGKKPSITKEDIILLTTVNEAAYLSHHEKQQIGL
ncbi:Gfo/Idh/MocA family protein [Metabacillus arenae]|uniref:Gfo/Idh/MocA family oxidoreductase n=1 Tax=Metabacillus arenae TaxID=2771434 RepID=A0A926NF78_9BACI|nr:Gfo/Idh/MocA family oxidoreductase [Metabacillus arenae]MBD1382379.1 Gfo/Idh/MocA family oxidoreductase [Metabacillus arenae]